MTATEIVPCRMCKGREDVRAPIIRLWSPVKWVSCMTLGCRCAGPERTTEAEACASWNELMQPSAQAAPEMPSEMIGLFAQLTPEQQKAALAYRGPDSFPAPEMQSKTVRVRIPVRVNHDDSIWIHYVDGDIRVGAHEWPVVAYITADLPLRIEPPEIPGTVEASDD